MSDTTPTKFTAENFAKGFLTDEELMAGISESKDFPGTFTAFVVRHTTGEMLGAHEYTNIFEAIRALNDIPRAWTFESVSKCGSGNCGNGKCGGGKCGINKKIDEKKEAASADAENCSGGNCH